MISEEMLQYIAEKEAKKQAKRRAAYAALKASNDDDDDDDDDNAVKTVVKRMMGLKGGGGLKSGRFGNYDNDDDDNNARRRRSGGGNMYYSGQLGGLGAGISRREQQLLDLVEEDDGVYRQRRFPVSRYTGGGAQAVYPLIQQAAQQYGGSIPFPVIQQIGQQCGCGPMSLYGGGQPVPSLSAGVPVSVSGFRANSSGHPGDPYAPLPGVPRAFWPLAVTAAAAGAFTLVNVSNIGRNLRRCALAIDDPAGACVSINSIQVDGDTRTLGTVAAYPSSMLELQSTNPAFPGLGDVGQSVVITATGTAIQNVVAGFFCDVSGAGPWGTFGPNQPSVGGAGASLSAEQALMLLLGRS